MNKTLLGAVVLLALSGTAAIHLSASSSEPQAPWVRLRLADEVDAVGGHVQYQIDRRPANSEGLMSFINLGPDRRVADIYTGYSPSRFRAVVYLRDRQLTLIDEPFDSPRRASEIILTPPPLRAVALRGSVSGVEDMADTTVVASYAALWCHTFFDRIDGPVTVFDVASGPLDRDGGFALNIPDFAADPSHIANGGRDRTKFAGRIQFMLKGPRAVSMLLPMDALTGPAFAAIEVASAYPEPIRLRLRR